MKTFRYLIFSLLFLIISDALTAQVTAVAVQDSSASNKSLLWEITGKNLKKPSYLYGTIHMIAAKDFFMTEATKASLEACEKVVFEINMENMTGFSAMFTMMTKIMMKNGTTLKDLLNPEDYQLVKLHFEKMGLPLFMLERIKPMFLSAFASGDMPGAGGLNSEGSDIKSYEMEFMNMAKKQEKEMDGLETIGFQMSIFDSIPYEAQAQMLVESIKAGNSGDDELDIMTEIYKQQDIEAMCRMIQDEDAGTEKYEEMLLVNRNRNWIPLMANFMKKKPTFFAVGAGHLGGETGVINLLRKEGYTLRPIH